MKNMVSKEEFHMDEFTDNLKGYVNTRVDLIKLEVMEKASLSISKASSGLIIAFLSLFFVMFGSAALGFLLGKAFDSLAAGFGAVAGFYLLLGVLAAVFKKQLIEVPILNVLVKAFFNHSDNGKHTHASN